MERLSVAESLRRRDKRRRRGWTVVVGHELRGWSKMVKSCSTNVGNAISSPSWLVNFHSDSGATFGSVPKAAWTLLNSCINITLDNPPSL
ncbi:hypothetical protein K0M31_008367 [Melipona bicolor]|uniref:Uncharacterized protein n=1 Tax=Melipona bicolor TaxID=60889 RepID=A0AA40KKI7_9HYME|nr:hypothetical protein K0M31_008367 [Melipona bicolor]